MQKKCIAPAKTYVVLKSSKVCKKRSISKQGKVIRMKCSGTAAAAKYAAGKVRESGIRMSRMYLYGKLTKYSIDYKIVGGKVRVVAKRLKVVQLRSIPKCRKSTGKASRSRSFGTRSRSSGTRK